MPRGPRSFRRGLHRPQGCRCAQSPGLGWNRDQGLLAAHRRPARARRDHGDTQDRRDERQASALEAQQQSRRLTTIGGGHMLSRQNASPVRKLSLAAVVAAAVVFGGASGRAGEATAASPRADASIFRTDVIPAPCHPNPHAQADMATLALRGDIRLIPRPLKERLVRLAGRPHTFLPTQTFAEADRPSLLFQYYLLDTQGFEPNVFTSIFPGVNDAVMLTATGGVCGIPTIGAVRLALEPKPDLPTDPNDVRAFIDIFTDIDPLFVINNESGWYEGWMIHDLSVAPVGPARSDGHAQFGMLLQQDADMLRAMGPGNNVLGHFFTSDGRSPRFPSASDHFPDIQGNTVPIFLSMGAYNAMQQSDVHSYWEFNY